jgi:hypothetical protein
VPSTDGGEKGHRAFRSVPATHQTFRRFAAGSSSAAASSAAFASAAGETLVPTADEPFASAGFFFFMTTPAIALFRCGAGLGAAAAFSRLPRPETR